MVDDVGALYGSLSGRLPRIVGNRVNAPPAVIDDACQVAWARLVVHAQRVDGEAVLQWLVATAVREAIRLGRREQRDLSLDARADEDGELDIPSPLPGPHELTEWRERLAEVSRLPANQRRFLWLRGVGYSYEEIAAGRPGLTERTVERQIQQGRRTLKPAA